MILETMSFEIIMFTTQFLIHGVKRLLFQLEEEVCQKGLQLVSRGMLRAGWDSTNSVLNDLWEYTDTTCNDRQYFTISACNSYTSPSGNIYTKSGQYVDTVSNNKGCDSIIKIELLINSNDTSISIVSCSTYKLSKWKNIFFNGKLHRHFDK